MSLAEIEKAVDALPPEELARLAAYIARQDKLAWDEQLEQDFAPGGKHATFISVPLIARIEMREPQSA